MNNRGYCHFNRESKQQSGEKLHGKHTLYKKKLTLLKYQTDKNDGEKLLVNIHCVKKVDIVLFFSSQDTLMFTNF